MSTPTIALLALLGLLAAVTVLRVVLGAAAANHHQEDAAARHLAERGDLFVTDPEKDPDASAHR